MYKFWLHCSGRQIGPFHIFGQNSQGIFQRSYFFLHRQFLGFLKKCRRNSQIYLTKNRKFSRNFQKSCRRDPLGRIYKKKRKKFLINSRGNFRKRFLKSWWRNFRRNFRRCYRRYSQQSFRSNAQWYYQKNSKRNLKKKCLRIFWRKYFPKHSSIKIPSNS